MSVKLSDLGRIRVLTRELFALLDVTTKALPTHRAKTLAAAQQLAAVVKALPASSPTEVDLGGVFDRLDAQDGEVTETNSAAINAE